MLPSLRSRGAHYIASALILVAALVAASAAVAEHAPGQRQSLAAALRQVDALELLVAQSAASMPAEVGGRYHFDYPRLLSDLDRVRTGIQFHLTPSRAQPRDLQELNGDYRAETELSAPLQTQEQQP
ncbi:MAG: hypothetical protein CMK75_00090 [Pseudomonadales bacterium]|nr:hypothetical protein [Pseudomonadales bacterium]|tara:strand:- start:641 stop:1021 length:381 start_codon:yes stop_codon:yes gene_type:complete